MTHEVQSGAITSIASLIFTDPSFKDDVKSEPVIQINSIGNDYMLKVRKPYTITKQREKWTEDEHQMLLQALKLYGRGWRQIKEHIGTKTAVQIRSHAQKFFSKVVRGSSGCEGTMKPIEIPPPRPKRKPLHPYPRKLKDTIEGSISNQSERSSSPNLSIAEKGTRSPTSLVSTIDSERIGFAASDQPNKYPSSTPCMTDMQSICPCQIKRENDHMTSNSISVEYKVSLPSIQLSACVRLENFLSMLDAQKSESGCKEPNCPGSESSNNSPNTSIKLFGRTLLVLEPQKESLMGAENTNFQIPSDNQNGFHLKDPVMSSDDLDTQLSLGGNVSCWNPSVYGFSINHSEHQKQSPSSSEARAPVLCWPFATKYHLPPNRI